MPISKEFLPLFKDFVSKYQNSGATNFYHLSKEHNHEPISKELSELLTIIMSNEETLHDISIVDYLNEKILNLAKTNPYLLDYWLEFKTKYRNAQQSSSTSSHNSIIFKVGPEGTPLEGIIRDLRNALIVTQTALTLGQQAHTTELELLKKQIQDLKKNNHELQIQNGLLREQVQNSQTFDSLHPQIVSAQEQLSMLSTLLTTLHKVTTPLPALVPINNQLLSTTEFSLTSTKPERPPEQLENELPVPPAPPISLELDILPISPQKQPQKNQAATVIVRASNPVSQNNFFEELNSKIRERDIRKQTSPIESPLGKKKLYTDTSHPS